MNSKKVNEIENQNKETGIPENEEIPVEKHKADNEVETATEELPKSQEEEIKEEVSLEDQINELKDQLLRKAAEFENYKRRTEVYQSELLKYAAESFILKVLPVYNDFERSLSHIKEAKDVDAIKAGLQLVFDKFTKALNEQGVSRMETVGKEFDFNLHEALLQQEVEDAPPNTVIQEVEPGYLYKDKVLKHAKVIVSKEKEETDSNEESENSETK
ncbi:MAG: nucleotide exchange factor GrpE [Melioribacteraceae bacterium]|nr:nucleotide exchange factor GrpE [Melioribacteraceae bacterium]